MRLTPEQLAGQLHAIAATSNEEDGPALSRIADQILETCAAERDAARGKALREAANLVVRPSDIDVKRAIIAQGRYHQQYISGDMMVHISDQPISVKSITINLETKEAAQ
jgi:hypothetical protein